MEKEIRFKIKDWVLVRDVCYGRWCLAQFANIVVDHYCTVGGSVWNYCIPYEGNEHLLGSTDSCVQHNEPKGSEREPVRDDVYYYVLTTGGCACDVWLGTSEDLLRYDIGNFFRTKEEARAMSEKIKKVLKGE